MRTRTPPALRHSTRDPAILTGRLQRWLRDRVADPTASAGEVRTATANGMSSDTVLFTARWQAGGDARVERLVARLAPDPADVPVFPRYDLPAQFATLRVLHARSAVPVPEPLWCEEEPEPLGSPFLVMRHVAGRVPPDVLPYTFGDNWLAGAPAPQRRALADATVDAIAALHAIPDAPAAFPFLARDAPGTTPLERHLAASREWYDYVAADGAACPLVEDGFAELSRRLPATGAAVLCWGDARVGNVLYRGFAPAALLDWEMAALGPPELDVGWLVCSHLVFQHLAEGVGLPGLPDFLRAEDVVARYQRGGRQLSALEFFVAYAALLWAVVLLRTGTRAVRFGERAAPARAEELLIHRALLERLLAA